MAEDTSLKYNFPYETYKNFCVIRTTGEYSSSATQINFASALDTGNLPQKLPYYLTWFNATDYPSVYDDPTVEIVRVSGVHQSGIHVIRAQEHTTGSTKIAGKDYYLIQPLLASEYDNKLKYIANPDETAYLFDDFDMASTSSFNLGWDSVGTTLSSLLTKSNRIGLFGPTRSMSNGVGTGYMHVNPKLFRVDSGPITFRTTLINASPSAELSGSREVEYRFGLGNFNSSSREPTNGVFFHYRTNSGISICAVKNSVKYSVATNVGSISQFPLTFDEYKIKVVNSGLAHFYFNNVEINSSPLTTNIPWGSGEEVGIFSEVNGVLGSNTYGLICDYVEAFQEFEGYRTEPLIYQDLVSYWPLHEVSGTGYDAHGSNHLTGVRNSPVGGSGILVSGRQFNSNKYLYSDNHTIHMSGSGIAMSVWGWFKPHVANTTNLLGGVWDTSETPNQAEWQLFITASNTLRFSTSIGGAASSAVNSDSSNTINQNQWNFFYAEYDNQLNKTRIRLNNQYSSYSTFTGFMTNGYCPLSWGGRREADFADGAFFFSGVLAELGFARRTLATGEVDYLYHNSGAVTYEALLNYNEAKERN